MKQLVEYLQLGIALTTPIFFFIVLIVLLRVLRTLDMSMKTLIYLQHRFEKIEQALGRGRRPAAPEENPDQKKEQPPKASE